MPIEREPCAPELPTSDDGSVAIDNLTESNRHRRRTLLDFDTGKVEAEQVIAAEVRRVRLLNFFSVFGAACGVLALAIEIFELVSRGL
ncbi:MAG TPA: hypothetical protein VFI56_09155 [Vicinamibacterales bacterium]|nr:hypothetical protein [Vicinamibacterales bacterium]